MALLDVIRHSVTTAVKHHGASDEEARKTANAVCWWILEQAGGRRHELPTSSKIKRDSDVILALNAGKTREEVAEMVGVSVRTIYRIRNRMTLANPDYEP